MTEYAVKHEQKLVDGGWIPPEPSRAQWPDSRVEARVYRIVGGLMLLILLIVAAFYAYLDSPAALRLKMGPLNRMVAIHSFYAHPPAEALQKKRLLAIGDSVSVYAFDSHVFDAAAGAQGWVGYNLALTGKGVCEYLTDIAEPLVQDSYVVTFVNPETTFGQNRAVLHPHKANMIRLLGYPLDRQAWDEYKTISQDPGVDYVFQPRYVHVLDSRWRLQENLFTSLKLASPLASVQSKDMLRAETNNIARDLKYAVVPIKVSPEEVHRLIERRAMTSPELLSGDFKPQPLDAQAIDFLLHKLSAKCRGLVIVLAPVHPEIRRRMGALGLQHYRECMQRYSGAHRQLIDLSELLDESDFRDDVHLTEDGAKKVTTRICEALGFAPGKTPTL